MKPTTLKPGQKLSIEMNGRRRTAYFIERIRNGYGPHAHNLLRFPDFEGLNGPDDNGICQMSDYDLSRKGAIA